MPIYEYSCKACGAELEIRQKFADDPLTDCPECGSPSLERLVSTSSFALKGDGWYADGYGPKKAESKSEGTKDTKDGKETKDSKEKTADKKSDDKGKNPAPSKSSSGSGSDMKKAS